MQARRRCQPACSCCCPTFSCDPASPRPPTLLMQLIQPPRDDPMRRAAVLALLFIFTAAAPDAAAARKLRAPHRRLAQLAKPKECSDLADLDFEAAFGSLDATCPQAAPFSCPEPCFQAMQTVRRRRRRSRGECNGRPLCGRPLPPLSACSRWVSSLNLHRNTLKPCNLCRCSSTTSARMRRRLPPRRPSAWTPRRRQTACESPARGWVLIQPACLARALPQDRP